MTPPTALDSEVLGAGEAPSEQDDIFGPSRSFPPHSDRPKPSMISAKLRAKEERKKVIQICTEKLEKIKDPDRNLRRSVCINNTYFKLQDEVRREKQLKHAPNNVRHRPPSSEQKQRLLDKALESIDRELNAIGANTNMPSLEHELLPELPTPIPPLPMDVSYGDRISVNSYSLESDKSIEFAFRKLSDSDSRCKSRKRSFSEIDEDEVLSHFCIPSSPRLMTVIDDDILDPLPPPISERITDPPRIPTKVDIVDTISEECARMKRDFESGIEEILQFNNIEMNQSKNCFQTFNSSSQEPAVKKMKGDTSPKKERFCQRRSSKSEFEIILDALRLDDSKDLCDREELMYLCSKTEKQCESVGGRYSSLDSCGQAAFLRGGEQQTTQFLGLPAELET